MDTALSSDRSIGVVIRSGRRLFREALAARLVCEPGLDVLGHVGSDTDLVRLCDVYPPDVVLFDADRRLARSLSTLGELRRTSERLRILVIYEHLAPNELAESWRLGADAWVPCSNGLGSLLEVLHTHADELRTSTPPARQCGALTDREREVMTLTATGHTAQAIAGLLGTSVTTIENCRRRIYAKLGVINQPEAIARAVRLGMVDHQRPIIRIVAKTGAAPLVLVRGSSGPTLSAVVSALLAAGVPFVHGGSVVGKGLEPWHQGPLFALLVDPVPADWESLDSTGLPIVLVRSTPHRRCGLPSILQRGVVAVLAADQVRSALAPTLTLAANGHLTMDADAASELVASASTHGGHGGLPELTVRESEILRSIAAGHTMRQTARMYGISEKTVENTQARLFRKLGARNRAGAVAAGYAFGLLAPS